LRHTSTTASGFLTIRALACHKNLFVAGADTWIDRVVADIPDAEKGFTLIFSGSPFPGHQYRLDWRREEGGGNWYYSIDLDMEGWLCPALFRYFTERAKNALCANKTAQLGGGGEF